MTIDTGKLTVSNGIEIFFKATGENGFRSLGNITNEPSINIVTSVLEHKTRRTGSLVTDKRVVTDKTMDVSLVVDEPNERNLQRYFLAETITNESGDETFEDEIIILNGTTTTELALPFAASSPVTSVKNLAGTTTYVADTDYEVDTTNNGIKIKSGGAISSGDEVRVTYVAGLPDRKIIYPLTDDIKQGEVRFMHIPEEFGTAFVWTSDSASIGPDGSISMPEADWMTIPLNIQFLKSGTTASQPFGKLRTWEVS